MNGFYNANTEETFNKVTTELLKAGYVWVGLNKKPTFKDCKAHIHGNAKLVIHAFHNSINGLNEIQCGTRSIYNTYPQYKGKLNVVNMA